MTDDEIRDVFAELHRVGVDLAQPPGLALGTGFGDGEFLAWLRALPDALGHDAFVARLAAHVSAAQPNVAGLPTRPHGRPRRLWPTVEQLHAVANIMAREWDPLGARLGDLTRDDVTEHISTALQIALSGQSPDLVERQVARFLGSVEREVFGVRPSPPEQRRYLARRVMKVVVDLPGPAHENTQWDGAEGDVIPASRTAPRVGRDTSRATARARTNVVGLGPRGDEPPPLDATATCSECGTVGTVAVVMRDVDPHISRFCPTCWKSARAIYWLPRMDFSEPPQDRDSPEGQIAMLEWVHERMAAAARNPARHVASAMWEDLAPFMNAALGPNDRESPADKERHLRMFARRLVDRAPQMYGPMPPEIERFVREHGQPVPPPASASDQHGPPATSS